MKVTLASQFLVTLAVLSIFSGYKTAHANQTTVGGVTIVTPNLSSSFAARLSSDTPQECDRYSDEEAYSRGYAGACHFTGDHFLYSLHDVSLPDGKNNRVSITVPIEGDGKGKIVFTDPESGFALCSSSIGKKDAIRLVETIAQLKHPKVSLMNSSCKISQVVEEPASEDAASK